MSYLLSQGISDVKSEFEGGNSLSVSWKDAFRRAGYKLLQQIFPLTLKRSSAIYGGMVDGIFRYYCPSDVLNPTEIYMNGGLKRFKYKPANFFYRSHENDIFTLEYIGGVRFLTMKHSGKSSVLDIDNMDTLANKTFTAPMNPVLDNSNVVFGSYAIQLTVSPTDYTISGSLSTIDLTNYLFGASRIAMDIVNAASVTNIELRYYSGTNEYMSMTTSADSNSDKFIDGWNMVRFDMRNRTQTSNFDSTAVNKWEIRFTVSQSVNITIDGLAVQKTEHTYLQYISNRLFIDQTTRVWKSSLNDDDSINLDDEARMLLHYEVCRDIGRKPIGGINFDNELTRLYAQYLLKNPAPVMVQTYDIGSDISLFGNGIAMRESDDAIFHQTGDSTTEATPYINAEIPQGVVDGSNKIFTLHDAPNPTTSLQLFVNGTYQIVTTDFTLSGTTITFVIAPSSGAIIRAYYYY